MEDAIRTWLAGAAPDERAAFLDTFLPSLMAPDNLLDNYNWRTRQIERALRCAVWPDVTLSTKRTGPDAWTPTLKNIEIKTTKGAPRFEFDKQTDPKRRAETLTYDAFVFARFDGARLVNMWVVYTPENVGRLRSMLEEAQARFLADQARREADPNAKRGRDSISIGVPEFVDFTWTPGSASG